jgi:hypothetical protein
LNPLATRGGRIIQNKNVLAPRAARMTNPGRAIVPQPAEPFGVHCQDVYVCRGPLNNIFSPSPEKGFKKATQTKFVCPVLNT